jgi:hypothetical protein
MATCNINLPCASIVNDAGNPGLSITNSGGDGLAGQSTKITGPRGLEISGNGVYGYSDAGNGVFGYSDKGGNGIVGQADNGGDAVYGESFNGGSGVHGYSESRTGYGVAGENNHTVGVIGFSQNIAVAGVCGGVNSVGVAGFGGSTTNNTGVYGDSGSGNGVVGQSGSGYGVLASSGTGIGLVASGVDRSASFEGNVDIQGKLDVDRVDVTDGDLDVKIGDGRFEHNLYASALLTVFKFFRIDHPLDPANKYLFHASVESSERKNVYDGTIELDKKGGALVELPDWFEALNKDIRYQLSAIGAPAPNLHIAEEITECHFRIGGGKPGMRVCWQVTGVRRDPAARYEPMLVEQDKPTNERGYYQSPEAHQQPRDKGIAYARSSASAPRRALEIRLPKIPTPARPIRPEIPPRGGRSTG